MTAVGRLAWLSTFWCLFLFILDLVDSVASQIRWAALLGRLGVYYNNPSGWSDG
jgi:hypothetical protein